VAYYLDVKVVTIPIMLHSALRRVLHAENGFRVFIEGGNQELARQLGPLRVPNSQFT
jgi:hypothetical protein